MRYARVDLPTSSWDGGTRGQAELETEGGHLGGLNIEVLLKSPVWIN